MRMIGVCIGIAAGLCAADEVQVEDFTGGLNNAFFSFEFEYDPCCWGIGGLPGDPDNDALRIVPNFVQITFDLAPGEIIESASASIFDYEGGIAGTPSSVVQFRGASGDFTYRTAEQLQVLDTVHASMESPGQLTGEPIGPIVQIDFQAANEYLPGGAFYDDLTVNIVTSCFADFNGDGSLSILDFIAFQGAFVKGDPAADCNGDEGFDVLDFVCFQGAFVGGCG